MAGKRATELTAGTVIKAMQPAVFKTLTKILPSGSLQARKQATGAVSLYWRYSIGTASERVLIGIYDPTAAAIKSLEPGPKGYSIAAAVQAAQVLAQEHTRHRKEGGRPALLAAQLNAKSIAAAEKHEAEKNTFGRLLDDYCDHLKTLGRTAHKDARSIFKLHITEAWPKVVSLPASQVTGEQIADMMRKVMDAGKGRTANKLRSYVRAAYQTARAARTKASIPVKFKAYNITHNPAADTEPDEAQNNADKNPLSANELRAYWRGIKRIKGFRGAVLRLHLLTGAQRIQQLVSLLTMNTAADSILLHDGKGRPGKPPRPHKVPLVPLAAAALRQCSPKGTYALSTDEGSTHLAATTLSDWAVEAAADIPDFQTKRIRSGVETLLASAGVSQEIRGRLQSHGISGVQARHYDGHEYLDEKRMALDTLVRLLEQRQVTNVTPINKRKRA